MNMQILSITLYNSKGSKRTIAFKLGKTNIITGKSNTGKSSIIHIVEYCLGRSGFQRIPVGPIRDTVEWFSVLYQIGENQVFIAKPKPDNRQNSQSQIYLKISNHIDIPEMSELSLNSNDDALEEFLTRLINISPNTHIPSERSTLPPLEATIRHASFFLYQNQGLIASNEHLFFRESEKLIDEAIRNTLPYFLGVIPEDHLRLVGEYRNARRDFNMAQRRLREAESMVSEDFSRGHALLVEAQQVGILDSELRTEIQSEILDALRLASQWEPDTVPSIVFDQISVLQNELDDLRDRFREKHSQIKTAELYAGEAEGYANEAVEQQLRLESINIFDSSNGDASTCPLCSASIAELTPAITSIQKSLTGIKRDLRSVSRERPRLREYIQQLQEERETIRQQIREKELQIRTIVIQNESARRLRDTNLRIAHVLGRISLYLDTIEIIDEISPLRRELDRLEQIVKSYERRLDAATSDEIKTSILNVIALDMTRWAEQLELEFSGSPYRLDINRLTVIADHAGKPISMKGGMGGGQNWLGCHLIAHFALHKYFIQNNRPVPSFLILDQPTQVYFPDDKYESMEGLANELTDDDRLVVKKLFDFIFDICESLSPNLQVIIMDHANIDSNRFQEALVESPWRGGNALIPTDWLNNE